MTAAEGVAELAGQRIPGDRVDREVATRKVLVERHAEANIGVSAVGGYVGAKGGHLDRLVRLPHAHRAVLDPDRVRPREELLHARREGVGRDVPVTGDVAEQSVPHGAAHGPSLVAGLPQAARHGEEPFRGPETRARVHRELAFIGKMYPAGASLTGPVTAW